MTGRVLAAALCSLVVLVGCSDDDDAPESIGDRAVGVCALLDADELGAATGEVFDDVEANDTTCTYSAADAPTIVGLSYTDLQDVPATDALALIQESCDEGTVQDLALPVAEAAFGCRVHGELSVAVAGGGHLAVIAGLGLDSSVSDAEHVAAIADVLDPLTAEQSAQES